MINPLVSVIAPVYNGEKYIERFILSIQNQTYKNWELILVDDGSTDNTLGVVDRYKDVDSIHIIKRPNTRKKGADTCRNIGQDNAKGDYYIIFDSDDLVYPNCIEQRVRFMEKNKQLDFGIFPGDSLIQKDDNSIIKGKKTWGIKGKLDPIVSLLRADYNFGVWNLIFRSETMLNKIRWDEDLKIYMDFDYMFSMLSSDYVYAFAVDASPDYGYIQGRSNAITASFVSKDKYLSTKYLFTKTLKSIDRLGNPIYRKYYYDFFISFYKKIIHSSDIAMLNDYTTFFEDSFPEYRNVRLHVLNSIIRKKIVNKKDISRNMDRMISFAYHPFEVIKKKTNLKKPY